MQFVNRENKRKNHIFLFVIIMAILLVINFKLIVNDPKLNLDDLLLINPLKDISSLSQYITKIETGEIFDIQPLRDISLLTNIQLEKWTGHGFFHGTNLILWILILWFTYSLLIKLQLSRYAPGLLLLLALHPSLLTCVFWISARKHLLSTLFILLATVLTIGKNRLTLKESLFIPFLYLCSLLSQPIHILWPFWFIAYGYFYQRPFDKRRLTLSMILGFLFLLFLYIQYHYYTNIYMNASWGMNKMVVDFGQSLDISLLGIARSFTQIFYPVSQAITYYVGNWKNILGIPILVVFHFLSWKYLKKPQLIWIFFIFVPLIIIYGRMTNIFVSDTYLLLPSIGILVVAALILERFKPSKRKFKSFIIITVSFLIFKSFQWSRAWESKESLIIHSHKTEITPSILRVYGEMQLQKKNFYEATQAAFHLQKWNYNNKKIQNFFSKAIFYDPNIKIEKKINIMREYYKNTPLFNHHMAKLYAIQKKWTMAYRYEKKGLQTLCSYKIHEGTHVEYWREYIAFVLPNIKSLCIKAKIKECSKELNKLIQNIPKEITKN